ncbi:hypothetical protein BJX65DRAFT_99498 [Aspergillus insuetus]
MESCTPGCVRRDSMEGLAVAWMLILGLGFFCWNEVPERTLPWATIVVDRWAGPRLWMAEMDVLARRCGSFRPTNHGWLVQIGDTSSVVFLIKACIAGTLRGLLVQSSRRLRICITCIDFAYDAIRVWLAWKLRSELRHSFS